MFHITKEGEELRNGLNFWLPLKKNATLFRFILQIPFKKEKDLSRYVSVEHCSLCEGFKVKYFRLYFRLRRFWPTFYIFRCEILENYTGEVVLETLEEWEDKLILFDYYDSTVWG